MQQDSMHSSSSGHTMHNQAADAEESSVESFRCSRCTLTFSSKVSLCQHLHTVHGSRVDRDDVFFSQSETNGESDSPGGFFLCQHCDFKAHSRYVLTEHERLCGQESDTQNVTETEIESVTSTSKSTCAPNSSKDVKKYKGPLQMQSITKYFAAASRLGGKPPAKSSESPAEQGGTKGTLILQESPSGSSPNSSGVFKVTAQSMIDISRSTDRFLLNDQILSPDLRAAKPSEQFKETAPGNSGKRTNGGRSGGRSAKKAKLDEMQDAKLPELADESELQPSSSTDLLFEISEDEEEKNVDLCNGDTGSTGVYLCKQCDYRDVGFSRMSAHYQMEHPYIRYDNAYIRDASDQSATFRCLECPVEFLRADDLERHYKENHPEAPDVFTTRSSELVFRCFVCPAVAVALRPLKVHYRVMHPTHKAGNSLLYCRYSAARCHEGSSELNACEKALGPERMEGVSPQNANSKYKEDRNTPSPLSPIPREADTVLYQCNHCEFSHKSVVVMHVHYQKKHPDEAVTIDKIKQSAPVTSQNAPQATPERSVTLTENPTPQTDVSSSSKNKAKPNISLSFKNLKNAPDAPETHSEESPAAEGAKLAADIKQETKTPPRKSSRAPPSAVDSSYATSPDKVFYCQFCAYSNTNIRSVVAHHNMKHAMQGLTCSEEVFLYNVKVQKKKLRGDAGETSTSGAPPDSRLRSKVDGPGAVLNPYACAEKLYFCQKCNYGNPTLKGVLNHQAKAHQGIHTNHKCIIKHTASIHSDIEKSKAHTTESTPSSHLPLPLMDGSDENRLFCHFCNYRHESLTIVIKHYFTIHRGFAVKAERIHQHTSKLFSQMGKPPPKPLASKEEDDDGAWSPQKKKKKVKKLPRCSPVSASSPPTAAAEAERSLPCHRCAFNTPYVYMLRRHMWKVHRSNNSMNDILKLCFKRGLLESGYHCDWCVFSHQNAAALFKHYREKHPEQRQSLECISSRLYVGSDIVLSRKKKPQTTTHADCVSGADSDDGDMPSPRSGPSETKTYSCRACSFKGSSVSSITSHYRAVHPWSVKDDGSVPNVITSKKPSANSHMADDDDRHHNDDDSPVFFDTYQVPLEFGNSPGSSQEVTEDSPTTLLCSHCPAMFSNYHGLKTHCGIKHPEAEIQTPSGVHVFNCPYCSYINSGKHGILTHCQMRHQDQESRADSHYVDETHLQSWGSFLKRKGDSLRFSGYLCKTCPELFATAEKLNVHCEKDHGGTEPNTLSNGLRPAPRASAVGEPNQSNTHGATGSASMVSFMNRCQLCSFSSTTKIALGRHVRVHHRNSSFSNVKDCVHKCVLCPRYYFTKTHLGSHYAKKHGRSAYFKFFTQVYNRHKPTSADCPLTRPPAAKSEAFSAVMEDGKILVYKCPSCDYVNASYHGILTHCQMKHPKVLARADDLKTEEVLASDMVRCSRGKSSNERGYMCRKCPQIHATPLKLKAHCGRDHSGAEPATSQHSTETEMEKWPHHDSRSSVSESTSSSPKNKSPATSALGMDLRPQPASPETWQEALQDEELPYKCSMCTYSAICRKYLYCHYKNNHKLDALGTFHLLKRYNKRKRKAPKVKCEESATVTCKRCPDLMFDSAQLLIAHYTTVHGSDCGSDFSVLSERSHGRSTGIYKCAHCRKQLYGLRKLCRHLDRHRARRKRKAMAAMESVAVTTTSPMAESGEIAKQDELQDSAQWNSPLVETFGLQASPLPSPQKAVDPELPPPELEPSEQSEQSEQSKRTCRHCRRTFMSLKGLRSHERSHAALAAIKKLDRLPTLGLKHNMSKYIVYKSGTMKPFLCGICSYRTTVLGLWRSHFRKKHQDVLMDLTETDSRDEENAQSSNKEPLSPSEENNSGPEADEEPEMAERSLYLEPPDVQRQLNHYMLMAQSGDAAKASQHLPESHENGLLHCEFCNFNTEHMSSVRRHYLNRHGKKILRCKDCSFFTSLRKTLEVHMETGHSTCQSEPTHQKDLRCPFCLYQTKNKNNMIDHIVLHREERVVPIEVCRPKLSRYLQGVVFRCHKCTFTSGVAENLRLHMTKHDDIKPYKCRLCYFDCTLLGDLEAHLSDKHQVVRNHELVGQVSLDQLKARVHRMPGEDEEEPLSNPEPHTSEEEQDVKGNIVTDSSEVLHEARAVDLADANAGKQTAPRMEDACLKQEQESQEQAGIVFSPDTARGQTMTDAVEPNVGNKADAPSAECIGSERERQTNEKQPKVTVSEDDGNVMIPRQKEEEAAEGSSTTYRKMVRKRESHKLNINALHILTMGASPDEEGGTTLAHKPTLTVNSKARKNHMQANHVRSRQIVTLKSDSPTPLPDCVRAKTSAGVSLANCREEQVCTRKRGKELTDPYGEMPILENEYLKDAPQAVGSRNEEEEDEMVIGDNKSRRKEHEEGDGMKEADGRHGHKGAGGASGVPCPSVTENKLYTCDLCGRNLTNSSDLKHHITRHGI